MTTFKIINDDGNVVLTANAKSKTIRGIRSELKKTSFAIKNTWIIQIEEPVKKTDLVVY